MRFATEVVILVIACLSPWAIGAVDAWAQLFLYAALVLLTVMGVWTTVGTASRTDWRGRLFVVPSLALGGLAVLALLQTAPLPAGIERTFASATHAWRAGLAPAASQRVQGDSRAPVLPPAATVSHDPDASLRTAAQLAAAWLLFQAVLGSGTGPGVLRRFGVFTVANACLVTLFAIAQALAWNGHIYGIRPVPAGSWFSGGPFVSHNHLAAYLNLAFGFALGFLLGTIQKRTSESDKAASRSAVLWAGSAAGLIFAGLIASHSRGGFIACVTATTVAVVLLRPRSVRLGATLGVMGVVSVLFLVAIGSTSPLERLASIKDANHDGFSGRTQVWGIALRTWQSSPIWGTGLGSFPAATASFYRQRFGDRYFSHAESEYFQMLTEGGIIGIVLALAAVAAIARLGRRARDAAPTPQERALVLGALAGGLALLIQCLSDFPLHVPGVAITAVVIAGHLTRLGLEARETATAAAPVQAQTRVRSGPLITGVAMAGLSGLLVAHGVRLARAEALVRSVGLPWPGALMPTVDRAQQSSSELKRTRTALEAALRLRPNWAEGHLRLGAVLLGQYSNRARELLGEIPEEKTPEALDVLSDPLWLHRVIHTAAQQTGARQNPDVLEHEPVRDYLVPATRSFLEARRCSPDLALSHARLAELDYLLEQGETTPVHAARALRLCGYDYLVLTLTGQAAAQAGDIELAAACWRKALINRPEGWTEIVLAAATVMSTDDILDKVLPPGGQYPFLLASDLFTTPELRQTREKYLRACLARLPEDPDLSGVERLWMEARARALLGERERARKLMMDAIVADPQNPQRREQFIDQLLAWGDVEEATRQARIGLTLYPDNPGIQRAERSAVDAFAQGNATAPVAQ